MSVKDIEDEFPKLPHEGYAITSEDTPDYNCFAFAAYDRDDWWSPLRINGYYWPDHIPRNTTVPTFLELYRYEGGFVPCEDGKLEPGFEKIALYMNAKGGVTHAARQINSGKWTSKLGTKEDIEHSTLTSLEDAGLSLDDYGKVTQFLKRKTGG